MTFRWGIGAGLAIVAAACAMQMNAHPAAGGCPRALGGVSVS
jgi:hypothetical protein